MRVSDERLAEIFPLYERLERTEDRWAALIYLAFLDLPGEGQTLINDLTEDNSPSLTQFLSIPFFVRVSLIFI